MLVVGSNKSPILSHLPKRFLIVDDGEISDHLPVSHKVTRFDPARHSFNPLKKLQWPKPLELLAIINAIFPQGENTLTRGNADTFLLEALTDKPKRLDYLVHLPTDLKNTGHVEAYRKIHTLLLSPVLKRVLTNQNRTELLNWNGTIIARLNRAEMGDFDCFVLGNLLISSYQGHVIVPDFGFYACPHHVSLIRQKRLTAGVHSLKEKRLAALTDDLLRMGKRIASHATYDDAETIALYAGLQPGHNNFIEEIARGMA